MAEAPLCNITVVTPGAKPAKPVGFKRIPTNATLQQAINIINTNFVTLGPQINQFFNQFQTSLDGGNWSEIPGSRVTVKVKVTDPQSGAFIEFSQINRVVMEDKQTGATWTWSR